MNNNDIMLDLYNVQYIGEIGPAKWWQRLMGRVPVGPILKEINLEVHSGEVMAILGSKGSGKKLLLDVIARRAPGVTRGVIKLNGNSLNLTRFQIHGGYVTQKATLIPGLTVFQTLNFAAALTLSGRVRKIQRVKQVMADMSLSQVSNWEVTRLNPSETKRLEIGIQIMKDPVFLMLEEPTADLDPLNTYFIISILANHAKKYKRIILLTMDKPRSDIFPLLDRVTYLCLGDVVYSGYTRMMLDYFRTIGFHCPELENPLMYYLVMSTVDRRTRDRFMESNSQIGQIVEKYKYEGGPYNKFAGKGSVIETDKISVPLSTLGKQPSNINHFGTLIRRNYRMLFNWNKFGFLHIFLRIFLLPVYFFLFWFFYFVMKANQEAFVTRNGLIFNVQAVTSFVSLAVTAVTFAVFRSQYYQERREGAYNGFTFIFAYCIFTLPLDLITTLSGSALIYWSTGMRADGSSWIMFGMMLWCIWSFVSLQTMCLMSFIKHSFTAGITSLFITILYVVCASGTVRSVFYLDNWLYYLSYIMIYRYSGAVMQYNEFEKNFYGVPSLSTNKKNCSIPNGADHCRYMNGDHYLREIYQMGTDDLNVQRNFGLCFIFPIGMFFLALLTFSLPIPNFIKKKFSD